MRYRGADRALMFELFSRLGFRIARHRVRADRRHRSPRTTPPSTRQRPWTPGARDAAPPALSRSTSCSTRPRRCVPRWSGWRSRTSRVRRATCRSPRRGTGAPRASRRTCSPSTRRPPRSRPALPPCSRPRSRGARGCRRPQDRPRPQGRHHRPGAPRGRARRHRHSTRARELRARRDPLEPRARGHCARGAQLPGHRRRRPARDAASRRGRSPTCRSTGDRLSPASAPTSRVELAPRLTARCTRPGSTASIDDLERPLIPVLVDIERAGVRVDAAVLGEQAARSRRASSTTRAAHIYEMAGETFNINSPKQLGDVLFTKLDLPALKRTGKTRTRVDRAGGARGAGARPRPAARGARMAGAAEAEGDLHRRAAAAGQPADRPGAHLFSQATAATGRLSSSEPNLQNVPIRTELGREIRRAFVAEPGWLLISADYSQIELRVLAHLSGDQSLIELPATGGYPRPHGAQGVRAASGLDPHELRRRAKIINYALLYGKTAFTLATRHRRHAAGGAGVHRRLLRRLPRRARLHRRHARRARETGIVTTMFGRRRLVPDVNNRNGQVRAAPSALPSTCRFRARAADILKRAMIDLHAALRGQARPAGAHDPHRARRAADRSAGRCRPTRSPRSSATHGARRRLSVPLTVDVGMGKNWKDAKA